MKAVFIIGPSGSGKTTLASHLAAMHRQFFGAYSAISVNLDCANEGLEEGEAEVDICDLVRLEDIMEECNLGPNGGLLYAAELLEQNVEWLFAAIEEAVRKRNPSSKLLQSPQAVASLKLEQLQTDNTLLIFDLPGQTQLFLSHSSLKNIIFQLVDRFRLQPCFLQLFDATYLYDLNDFTAMAMMALATICNLQIPHVAVLNKIDRCKGRRPSDGTLDSYFSMASLQQLLSDNLPEENPLATAIARIIDEYSQVSFSPCSADKPDLLLSLFLQLEKIFGTLPANLLAYKGFAQIAKDMLSDVGGEEVRVGLECELFGEEEEIDFDEELKKIRKG